MKKAVVIAFVLCLFAAVSSAQEKTGTLKGKVENEKGKPLADVEVTAMRSTDRATKEARADQSGNYSFELEPGDYWISFNAEGYQSARFKESQQVEEGKETAVKTVRLLKESHTSLIRGAVFDAKGFSLPGVRLKLMRVRTEDEERAGKRLKSFTSDYVTNNRGEFAFRVPSERGRYQVTASLNGFKAQTKVIDVNESESVPLAFSLEPVKK